MVIAVSKPGEENWHHIKVNILKIYLNCQCEMFSSIAGFFSQSYLPRSIWCTGVTTSQSKYQDVKTEERKTYVSLANYLHVLTFLKLNYSKELTGLLLLTFSLICKKFCNKDFYGPFLSEWSSSPSPSTVACHLYSSLYRVHYTHTVTPEQRRLVAPPARSH